MIVPFGKHPLTFSLLYQLSVVIVVMLMLSLNDFSAARSFGFGSTVYILPNVYFIIYAFRYKGARLTPWIVKSFKWGESGKLALSMMGFALVFRFAEDLNVAFVFAGFFTMILLQWWLAWRIAKALDVPTEES